MSTSMTQQQQHQHKSRSAIYKSHHSSREADEAKSFSSHLFAPIKTQCDGQQINKLCYSQTSPFTKQIKNADFNVKNSIRALDRTKHLTGINNKSLINATSSITLVVDDTRFIVEPDMFRQHSNTMLGRMFSSTLEPCEPNERGEYPVAYGVSAHTFKAILDYYRHGFIRCPHNVSVVELKEACDYLLIPFDGKTIKSNDLGGLLNE